MKSSLKKIRDFALHRGDQTKDSKKRDGPHMPVSPHEELLQAAKEMQDMKNGYDSLFSAAAATANSAYEFSEALGEMGSCLLEKITLNNDDESCKVLWMLGKAQFELQKFVNSYRAHVIQTITTPSESLLRELQTVEEMKRQCDDKRELYKFMQETLRDSNTNSKGGKSSSKQGKGADSFSYEQVKQAQDEYNEEATLFVFRLKSLKQGQFRSLLTQATRHHAAQLNFFRKGVSSLEAVEPQVKAVAESQHIDYHFTELDYDLDDDDDDDNGDMYPDGRDDISNDGSELSFDCGQRKRASNATAQFPRKSLEEHVDSNQSDTLSFTGAPNKLISQSEPLLPNKSPDPSDRITEMLQRNPSVKRNPNSYVLPTPTGELSHPRPSVSKPDRTSQSQPLWFSSPLQPNPNATIKSPKENEHLLPTPQKLPLKESNVANPKNRNRNTFDSDTKKAKISELHELPRPPPASSPILVPHSAPLVSKSNQEREKEKRATVTSVGASKNVPSPLPAPPVVGAVMARSYSIPSRVTNRREDGGMDAKLVEGFKEKNLRKDESPPLTPIALRNVP